MDRPDVGRGPDGRAPRLRAELHKAASHAAVFANDPRPPSRSPRRPYGWPARAKHTSPARCTLWAGVGLPGLRRSCGGPRDSIEGLEICDRNDFVGVAPGPCPTWDLLRCSAAAPWPKLAPGSRKRGRSIASWATSAASSSPSSTLPSATALHQGDLPAAERYAIEAIEISSGTGWETSALVIYGEALAARGDLDAAGAATARALGVALSAGLENWFRMAVRDLARIAAARGVMADAALFLGASRRNMPSYGLDPSIYGPLEERCRAELGGDRFERLVDRGFGLTHDDLIDMAPLDGSGHAGTTT